MDFSEAFSSNKDLVLYNVHALAVTNIIAHHQRRSQEDSRVFGVLLGTYTAPTEDRDAVVTITDSFALQTKVLGQEEDSVSFEEMVLTKMIRLKKMANPDEIVVGWYSTNTEQQGVNYISALLDQALGEKASQAGNPAPCYLTVDTNLKSKRLKIRCYRGKCFRLPAIEEEPEEEGGEAEDQGEGPELEEFLCRFNQAPLQLVLSEPEKIALDLQDPNETNPFNPSAILPEMELTRTNLGNLLMSTVDVKGMVQSVVDGDAPADPLLGWQIASALSGNPQLDQSNEWAEKRGERVNDILMLKLLSSMTTKQCGVAKQLPGPTK